MFRIDKYKISNLLNLSAMGSEAHFGNGIKTENTLYEFTKTEMDIIKHYQNRRINNMLEIGCSSGDGSAILSSNLPVNHTYSIDRSEQNISIAKTNIETEYSNLFFSVGSPYNTRMIEDKFDLIYSRFMYYNIMDPLKSLDELKRVLKPKGKIILLEYDPNISIFTPEISLLGEISTKHKKNIENIGNVTNNINNLPQNLHEAGFKNVDIQMKSISSQEFGMEYFIDILLSVNKYLFHEELCSNELKNRLILKTLKSRNQVFGVINLINATAEIK